MRGAPRMRLQHFSILALVATLGSPSIAQAQFVTYTSQASFLAAITNPGVDTFVGFSTTSTTAAASDTPRSACTVWPPMV